MMRITTVRELRLQPWDVALLPTGELLTFSWSSEGRHVEAYDPDLALVWTRNLGEHAWGLRVDQGGIPWVIDRKGAFAFNTRGEVDVRIDAPVLEGMEVASLTFVDDDLVFAYEHAQSAGPDCPALARLTRNGTVRWLSRLTSKSITFGGNPRHLSRVDKLDRFRPTTWVCGYHHAGDLTISGDAVLAVYSDMPVSGIAIGYAVALADGILRYTTKRGPIDNVAPRGAGEFLVGYQGYGAFETVSYDRGGNQHSRWPSQGFYVVSGDDIRVIELENRIPSLSRLTRLAGDGTVTKGDLLEGYYTSRPYVHDDGTVYFARAGMMILARGLVIEERILIRRELGQKDFYTRALGDGSVLFLTYTTQVSATSTSASGSVEHLSGLIRIAI